MNSNLLRFLSCRNGSLLHNCLCYNKTVARVRQGNYSPGRPPNVSLRNPSNLVNQDYVIRRFEVI